jgi:hypothetical protein
MSRSTPPDSEEHVEMEVVVIVPYDTSDESVRQRLEPLLLEIYDRLHRVGSLGAWDDMSGWSTIRAVQLRVSDSDNVLQKIKAALKDLGLPPGSVAERRPRDLSKVDMRTKFKDTVDLWKRPPLP